MQALPIFPPILSLTNKLQHWVAADNKRMIVWVVLKKTIQAGALFALFIAWLALAFLSHIEGTIGIITNTLSIAVPFITLFAIYKICGGFWRGVWWCTQMFLIHISTFLIISSWRYYAPGKAIKLEMAPKETLSLDLNERYPIGSDARKLCADLKKSGAKLEKIIQEENLEKIYFFSYDTGIISFIPFVTIQLSVPEDTNNRIRGKIGVHREYNGL